MSAGSEATSLGDVKVLNSNSDVHLYLSLFTLSGAESTFSFVNYIKYDSPVKQF